MLDLRPMVLMDQQYEFLMGVYKSFVNNLYGRNVTNIIILKYIRNPKFIVNLTDSKVTNLYHEEVAANIELNIVIEAIELICNRRQYSEYDREWLNGLRNGFVILFAASANVTKWDGGRSFYINKF